MLLLSDSTEEQRTLSVSIGQVADYVSGFIQLGNNPSAIDFVSELQDYMSIEDNVLTIGGYATAGSVDTISSGLAELKIETQANLNGAISQIELQVQTDYQSYVNGRLASYSDTVAVQGLMSESTADLASAESFTILQSELGTFDENGNLVSLSESFANNVLSTSNTEDLARTSDVTNLTSRIFDTETGLLSESFANSVMSTENTTDYAAASDVTKLNAQFGFDESGDITGISSANVDIVRNAVAGDGYASATDLDLLKAVVEGEDGEGGLAATVASIGEAQVGVPKTFNQDEAPSVDNPTNSVWYDTNDGNKAYILEESMVPTDPKQWVELTDARLGELDSIVSASRTFKVDAGGHVAGMKIGANDVEGGYVSFLADTFRIYNPTDGGSEYVPFEIVDGTVKIKSAAIRSVTFGDITGVPDTFTTTIIYATDADGTDPSIYSGSRNYIAFYNAAWADGDDLPSGLVFNKVQGKDGAAGTSVKILGSVGSEDDLPSDSGVSSGDGYLIEGDLWVFDGTEWNNVGSIEGPKGDKGDIGPAGPIKYTWIKYSNSTTSDGDDSEITDDPADKKYIGFAYNNNTAEESLNHGDYKWSLIKGANGINGTSNYFHVAYANDTNGDDFSADPGDRAYVASYVSEDPDPVKAENPLWQWRLIRGEDGANGAAGKNGYIHIAYANSDNGEADFDIIDSTGRKYIGQYTDFVFEDSTNPSDYRWSLIKGEDGVSSYFHLAYADDADGSGWSTSPTGKGYIGTYVDNIEEDAEADSDLWNWQLVKGADGHSPVLGEDYDLPPAGKSAYELWKEEDPANADKSMAEFLESLIGAQGPQGDSIKGDPGPDGISRYTWIKYADTDVAAAIEADDLTADIRLYDFPKDLAYIGFAFAKNNEQESDHWADYKWSKFKPIKGEDYFDGNIGETGQSAFEAWLASSDDNEGKDIDDFLNSLIGAEGPKGDSIEGPKGPDGKSTYTWIKYSYFEDGADMSNTPGDRPYIGFAFNRDEATESEDPSDYLWTKYKGSDGTSVSILGKFDNVSDLDDVENPEKGDGYLIDGKLHVWSGTGWIEAGNIQGPQGIQGVQGPDGYKPVKGIDYYDGSDGTFVSFIYKVSDEKPADPTGGSYDGSTEVVPDGWTDEPSPDTKDVEWMSTRKYKHNSQEGDPNIGTWTQTDWSTPAKIFQRGIDGAVGPAGQSAFEAWKAANPDNTGDISEFLAYLVGAEGPKGDSVEGPPGPDGKTTYTWIKYADSDTGSNMQNSPGDKKYIGFAFNKESSVE